MPRKTGRASCCSTTLDAGPLSPDYVGSATGLELHQFKWLESETLIGGLPAEWNHLVGEYPFNADARNVHFTIGGPYFDEYSRCDYASDWFAARDATQHACQRNHEF